MKRQTTQFAQCPVSPLERRVCLAAAATLSGGTLSIVGTPAADHIEVRSDSGSNELIVKIEIEPAQRFSAGQVNRIRYFGGDGTDYFLLDSAFNIPVTMYGGEGADQLFAGSGGGVRGYGEAGDDFLNVWGKTRDTLYGGDGDDILGAAGAHDVIYGEAGNDNINGGFGRDRLDGGDGNDAINAGGYSFDLKSDTVFGGAGNDTISAWAGDDSVDGGDGDDLIIGWSGHDTLLGGAGIDVIYGNDENGRSVNGNDGPDTFLQSELDSNEVKDFEDGVDDLIP